MTLKNEIRHDETADKTALLQWQSPSLLRSFISLVSAASLKIHAIMEKAEEMRQTFVGSGLFSVRMLLLATPTLGLLIQCVLFLFGRTCSPFPMWISFLLFSLLALLVHWKVMLYFNFNNSRRV